MPRNSENIESKGSWKFDLDHLTLGESLVIVGGFLGIMALTLSFGHDAFIKWGGLSMTTLALFGLFINDSRPLLRTPRFWKVTAILFALHTIAWIVVLMHVREWGLLWFGVMVFELPTFIFARDRPV